MREKSQVVPETVEHGKEIPRIVVESSMGITTKNAEEPETRTVSKLA
jgi:hypothetical protein